MIPYSSNKYIDTNSLSINNKCPIRKKYIRPASFNSFNSYLLYLLVVFIVVIKPAYSTTAICILRNGTITIGIDSRAYTTNFKDTTFYLNCKIIQVDSFFIAFIGISDYKKTKFSITNIAKNTLGGSGSVDDKIISFRDLLYTEFVKVMAYTNATTPVVSLDSSRFAIYGCSVLILGIRNITPFVYHIQYKVKKTNSVIGYEIDKKFKGIYCSDSTSGIIFVGKRNHIYEFEETDSTYWKRNDPVEVINFFIGLEIVNEPTVGLPIDILQINSTGYRWIQRKDDCYEYDFK